MPRRALIFNDADVSPRCGQTGRLACFARQLLKLTLLPAAAQRTTW